MLKIAVAVLLGLSMPTLAQTADYETQRAAAKAPQFESEAELRDQSRPYLGKIVELSGTVQGTFSRGEALVLMLQLPDGTQLINAPAGLRANPVLRAGTFVRALCRVDGISNGDVNLFLTNVTDQAAPVALLKTDDDDGVTLAPPSANAPAPAAILLAPEVDLPSAPQAQRGDLAARALPAPRTIANAQVKAAANPYYGFSDFHRANYRNFIRRANPRISAPLADTIAAAILSASQAQNLDPRFLCAVVQVESTFDPTCLSSSGAMGLGQLMPFNLKPLGVQNAWDPMQNLHGAAKLLRRNLDTYAAQKDGTLLAVAAYHAGVGAVNRAGMKVPKATTQRYVWKVYYAYRALAPELFN